MPETEKNTDAAATKGGDRAPKATPPAADETPAPPSSPIEDLVEDSSSEKLYRATAPLFAGRHRAANKGDVVPHSSVEVYGWTDVEAIDDQA